MAENADQNTSAQEDSATTIVTVPQHLAQQVIEFVNSLESDESDVSGHAFTRGGMAGGFGTMAAKGWTGTSCTNTAFNTDMTCTDTDEIVTK